VGAIRIGPRETLFEIAGPAAADFALAAAERDPRAPHVTIQRMTVTAAPAKHKHGRTRPPAPPHQNRKAQRR
jgi:hypothetical protein